MIIRLVRMSFRPEAVDDFLSLYDSSAPRIRAFEGCHLLELWQDPLLPHNLTTHSHWTSAHALEAYRQSDLFRATWARTKPLFAEAPQAFSYQRLRHDLVEPNS